MTQARPLIDVLQKAIEKQFDIDRLLASFYIDLESHVIKKNRRPIYKGKGGSRFLGKSNTLRSAEKQIILQLKSQAAIQNLKGTINQPLWVIYHFYFPKERYLTKKGPISKKLPDLTNLIELPQDCLTGANIIEDDSLIHSVDLSRRLIGKNHRLEIFILSYSDPTILPESHV